MEKKAQQLPEEADILTSLGGPNGIVDKSISPEFAAFLAKKLAGRTLTTSGILVRIAETAHDFAKLLRERNVDTKEVGRIRRQIDRAIAAITDRVIPDVNARAEARSMAQKTVLEYYEGDFGIRETWPYITEGESRRRFQVRRRYPAGANGYLKDDPYMQNTGLSFMGYRLHCLDHEGMNSGTVHVKERVKPVGLWMATGSYEEDNFVHQEVHLVVNPDVQTLVLNDMPDEQPVHMNTAPGSYVVSRDCPHHFTRYRVDTHSKKYAATPMYIDFYRGMAIDIHGTDSVKTTYGNTDPLTDGVVFSADDGEKYLLPKAELHHLMIAQTA